MTPTWKRRTSGGHFDSGSATPEPQHNFRVTEGSDTLTADGAWVDITSYTNMEGEDDSGEATQYYSFSGMSGELTFLESGTSFFLYLTADFTNADTPADETDWYGVDIELRKNGSSTVLSVGATVLKGLGVVFLGTYNAGQSFTAGDTLAVRARVAPLLSGVDVSLTRLDWGVRWIE